MASLPNSHESKQAAILVAALDIFGRDGFADGNVDEIAQRAGVAKPTIYNRFGDKRALFVAAMKLGMAQANERVMAAVQAMNPRPADLRAELEALGAALGTCMTSAEGGAIVRVQVADAARFPELAGDNQRELHIDALAGKLAQLIATGHLRMVDPQLAARQFMVLVTAEALNRSGYGRRPLSRPVLEEIVAQGVDTFLAAFGKDRP
jgi:AcrR family transcriptional regulator